MNTPNPQRITRAIDAELRRRHGHKPALTPEQRAEMGRLKVKRAGERKAKRKRQRAARRVSR